MTFFEVAVFLKRVQIRFKMTPVIIIMNILTIQDDLGPEAAINTPALTSDFAHAPAFSVVLRILHRIKARLNPNYYV